MPTGYAELVEAIKADVQRTQVRAAVAANRELIALYWRMGQAIVARQVGEPWGSAVLERLATDLRRAFPGVAGFSTNLFRIRAFVLAWADPAPIVPQAVGQMTSAPGAGRDGGPGGGGAGRGRPPPWGHNVALSSGSRPERPPLVRRGRGGARMESAILERQIDARLHERQGQAVTNFAATLPAPDWELARQTFKDLRTCSTSSRLRATPGEREVERGLMAHVERFLLELGAGFAFVGRQVHLEVGQEDYYVDLLFYHLRLRCFVVVELKDGPFRPEYAGKLNFYLSAVDD